LEKPKKLLRPKPDPKKKIPIGPQKAQYHPRKQKNKEEKPKKSKKTNKSYKIEGINHKKHVKLTSK
tara:strand:+ start:336 stop:533 length:198 start_codon:yes stop_codon:yes gene_type:complete